MFVKISKNHWVNLNTYVDIEIQKDESNDWNIVFYPVIISDREMSYSIGPFRLESEAHEVLDEIWECYREGKAYYEPDPRKKMNVRLGAKWYADDEPIQTYLEVIQHLGLEKIEERELTFKDKHIQNSSEKPIVTKEEDRFLRQSKAGDYYILRLERLSSMKEVLESIASELGIIDFEVTIYDE